MVETCDTFFAQLAPRLKAEIVREIKRLEVVLEMILTVEAERDAILTEKKSTHLNADKIKMLSPYRATPKGQPSSFVQHDAFAPS